MPTTADKILPLSLAELFRFSSSSSYCHPLPTFHSGPQHPADKTGAEKSQNDCCYHYLLDILSLVVRMTTELPRHHHQSSTHGALEPTKNDTLGRSTVSSLPRCSSGQESRASAPVETARTPMRHTSRGRSLEEVFEVQRA